MGGSACGDGPITTVTSYGRLRRELDEGGYRDVMPLEALPLVQHLFRDLKNTTHSLKKTLEQYYFYKQIAEELETGVAPFKAENVRLIQENSHFRMAAVRLQEECEDRMRSIKRRVCELEEEKRDLKLLVNEYRQQLKELELEFTESTGKISRFREKDCDEFILTTKAVFETKMDILPNPCYCVRVKNCVGLDKSGDQKAIAYFKIADARIEALQLQIHKLKEEEKEMTEVLSSMKCKVENRDKEIEKLRKYVTVRPGSDNKVNGMKSTESNKDFQLQLKSAEMQLEMLQKRNINLENKLKSAILQEHEDFMMGRTRTPAERELIRGLADLDLDNYPSHPEMTMNDKLLQLEARLANCIKEKTALKSALEKCEAKNMHNKDGSNGIITNDESSPEDNEAHSGKGLPSTSSKNVGQTGNVPLNQSDVPVDGDQGSKELSKTGSNASPIQYIESELSDPGVFRLNSYIFPNTEQQDGEIRKKSSTQLDVSKSQSRSHLSIEKSKRSKDFEQQSASESKKGSSSKSQPDANLDNKSKSQSKEELSNKRESNSKSKIRPSEAQDDSESLAESSDFQQTMRTKSKSLPDSKPKYSLSKQEPPRHSINNIDLRPSLSKQKISQKEQSDVPKFRESIDLLRTEMKAVLEAGKSFPKVDATKSQASSHHRLSTSQDVKGSSRTQKQEPHSKSKTRKSTSDARSSKDYKDEEKRKSEIRDEARKVFAMPLPVTEDQETQDSEQSDGSNVPSENYDTEPRTRSKALSILDVDLHSGRESFDVNSDKESLLEGLTSPVNNFGSSFSSLPHSSMDEFDNTLTSERTGQRTGSPDNAEQRRDGEKKSKKDPEDRTVQHFQVDIRPLNNKINESGLNFPGQTSEKSDMKEPSKVLIEQQRKRSRNIIRPDEQKEDVDSRRDVPRPKTRVTPDRERPAKAGDIKRVRDRDQTDLLEDEEEPEVTRKAERKKDRDGTPPSDKKRQAFQKPKPDSNRSKPEAQRFLDAENGKYGERERSRAALHDENDSLVPSGRTQQESLPKPQRSIEKGASSRDEERLGRIDELMPEPLNSRNAIYKLGKENQELKQEMDSKNEKLRRVSQNCDKHLEELSQLQTALRNAEQVINQSSQSKESLWEQDMEIQRLKRHITSLQKDVDLLAKEKDDALEECRRLSREISMEKNRNENYKWSSSNLQQQFPRSQFPQAQREDIEMSRRLREQAAREQDLEREIVKLKSNLTLIDRNKNEILLEIEHKDERLSRMNQECERYKTELSRLQQSMRSTDVLQGGSLSGRDQEVQYLKRQNETLRRDLDDLRKEKDEVIRDNRRLATVSTTTSFDRNSINAAASLVDRSAASQLLPQRDQFEMARRLRQQAAREQELEDEIARVRSSVGKLDRDKDEMRGELDRKDEKLARMNQDCEKHLAELSKLQLAVKNAEYQLGHTGDTAREHEREVQLLKRQLETMRRDLEAASGERDEAVKDCRRLASIVSKEEIDRRSLNEDFEKKQKEAEELRKQVQKYIEEVRRIEDLLLQKEEEMEMLIEHYSSLSMEKSTLENQRSNLESEANSIREDVRETVDSNITLKNQLTSQNSLLVTYEQEIEKLTLTLTTMENQMSGLRDKDKTSDADVKAARDMLYILETKMDKLRLDLANSDATKTKLEAENEELKSHIQLLEFQVQEQMEKEKKLQDLIASVREKEFEVENSTQDLASERDQLAEKLKSLQTRSESLNEEVVKFRLRSTELQNELDRTKRQLQSEKTERDSAIAELRRVQEQLNNSSTNALLNSALAAGSGSSAPVSGESGPRLPFSPMSESYLNSPVGASTSRVRDDSDTPTP